MFRVLLVDDDESLRQLLAYKLKQDFGFVINEASSGYEAISLIKQGAKYSLIVSDYNMPDGNGAEFQNYLVEHNIKSLFFFYTSEAGIEINPAHKYFLGVIAKPHIQKLFEKLVFEICTSNLKKKWASFLRLAHNMKCERALLYAI